MQVLNADGTQPNDLFFTIAAERLEASDLARTSIHGNGIGYARSHPDLVVRRRAHLLRLRQMASDVAETSSVSSVTTAFG